LAIDIQDPFVSIRRTSLDCHVAGSGARNRKFDSGAGDHRDFTLSPIFV
jgi:hypothetical protein